MGMHRTFDYEVAGKMFLDGLSMGQIGLLLGVCAESVKYPDGTTFTVVYDEKRDDEVSRWRARYEPGDPSSWLGLQIGDRGMAVVTPASPPAPSSPGHRTPPGRPAIPPADPPPA